MKVRAGALLALLAASAPHAAPEETVPPLTSEHRHPSGAFWFRTPGDWRVTPGAKPGSLDVAAAAPAAGARLRILYEPRDLGYDSLHVSCMDVRLLGPMETEPHVKYEYDFLSATIGERRLLDSAFVVRYERDVDGSRDWRQRNLTVAGPQEALCLIVYAPLRLWKKSEAARTLLDAVVRSLAFPPPPAPSPRPDGHGAPPPGMMAPRIGQDGRTPAGGRA